MRKKSDVSASMVAHNAWAESLPVQCSVILRADAASMVTKLARFICVFICMFNTANLRLVIDGDKIGKSCARVWIWRKDMVGDAQVIDALVAVRALQFQLMAITLHLFICVFNSAICAL